MTEKYNRFIYADDKSSKRGSGVNAVLKLMSETIAFNDKLVSCIDAQEDPKVKQALEQHASAIEDLYSTLSSVAKDGIRSFSDNSEVEVEVEEKVEKKPIEPTIVNAPRIPTMK